MDIKSLWTKLDQITEATDQKSMSEESCNECGGMIGECDHQRLDEGSMKRWLENAAVSMEKEDFVGNAAEYGMQPEEAIEFWNNVNGFDDLEEGEMSSRLGDKGETIRVHKAKAGGYGRKIDKDDDSGDKFHSSDIDDTDDAPVAAAVKRGRGRPVKNANSDTGEAPKFDPKVASALQSFMVGNLPKKHDKIGKVSHVHRLKEYMQQVEEMKAGVKAIKEVAIGGTGTQTAQQQPQAGQPQQPGQPGQTAQPAKVMAGGKIVGTAPNPQAATQATPLVTDIQNKQKQLAKLGVSQVQESLADTMNKFSAALDAPRKKRQLTESTLKKVELVMEGTLEEILQVYPHEHKMCQEGWGMDEAMFEALCDHYHREGKIPRAVWHGPTEALREFIEECYMTDSQELEEGKVGSAVGAGLGTMVGGPVGGVVGGVAGDIIGDKISPDAPAEIDASELDIPEKSTFNPYNQSATPAKGSATLTTEGDDLVKELDEELDRVLSMSGLKKENAMYESKKPSAGLSAKEKSSIAKKAHKGGDIGKPGKGFAKVAAKAAKEYGSAEKGKKVAAAAMWKNAAHQKHESVEEGQLNELSPKTLRSYGEKAAVRNFGDRLDRMGQGETGNTPKMRKRSANINKAFDKADNGGKTPKRIDISHLLPEASDEQQIAHDMGAKKRGIAREKNRAEITSMMSAEHPTKKSGEREEKKIGQYNRQLTKPEVVGEAKRTAADNKAEKAGKKVTKDLEYDMKHKGKDDKKAEKAGKKVTKDIEWDEKHKLEEGKFGQMDADLADLSPAEFKKEYGMTKAEARLKHGGKKPAAKAPVKKEKVAESYDFSEWDQQLSQLIEGKQPQKISESVQRPSQKQRLNEAGLADLIAMIKNAGMEAPSAGVAPAAAPAEVEVDIESDPEQNTAAYRDGGVYDGTGSPALTTKTPDADGTDADDVPIMAMPRGMGMSQNTDDGVESHVVEPVMSDEVIDHLQSGESDDNGDNTLAFIKKTMNHGEAPVEVKQTGGDYADEVEEDNEPAVSPAATGGSPSAMANKPAPSMNVHEEDEELEEDDVEEGNAFSGAVAKAKADGIQKGEKINVGGKEYPVKEDGVQPPPAGGEINPNNGDLAADVEGEAAQDNAGAAFDQAQAASQPMREEGDDESSHEKIGNMLKKIEKILAMHKKSKGSKEKVEEDDNMNMVANRHSELEVMEDLTTGLDAPEGQSLAKLARVVKSVQTPEQYETARKYAQLMFKRLDDKNDMWAIDKTMGLINDIKSDLKIKARELGIGIGGAGGSPIGHHLDESVELTEWANTPSQLIDDETFTSDIDFMTRSISGGLNNQKQDQTTLGQGPLRVKTQTEREDVNQSMGALLKKLGGIN